MLDDAQNRTLAQGVVGNHVPLQNAEGIAMLRNMIVNPDGFYEEMRRYSCSLTLSVAYGKRAPTFEGRDSSGFSVQRFYELEHAFNCACLDPSTSLDVGLIGAKSFSKSAPLLRSTCCLRSSTYLGRSRHGKRKQGSSRAR